MSTEENLPGESSEAAPASQDLSNNTDTNGAAEEKPGATTEENPGTGLSEDHVREALKEVIDPELFVNIVDLGLIYTVNLTHRDDSKYDVEVEMTMTSPMCPAGPQLVANSRQVVSDLEQVEDVEIKVVMDPPWTQDMMSEDAKDQLNIF